MMTTLAGLLKLIAPSEKSLLLPCSKKAEVWSLRILNDLGALRVTHLLISHLLEAEGESLFL